LKEDKPFVLFIRHLHHTTDTTDIATELRNLGHFPSRITNVQIKKRIEEKQALISLPLFRVELEPRKNNNELLDVEYILYTKVKVELPRPIKEVPQCKRCQSIGHSKNYCTKAAKCVKCGENHLTSVCSKPKSAPCKCANCGGNHTANYKGCPAYKAKTQPITITATNRLKLTSQAGPPTGPNVARSDFTAPSLSYSAAANRNTVQAVSQRSTTSIDPSKKEENDTSKILAMIEKLLESNKSFEAKLGNLVKRVESLEKGLSPSPKRKSQRKND
jgi:flagellin-like hook-associated protein FlgL